MTIETANLELDGSCVPAVDGLVPGAYVMLAVADNGIGMDAATQRNVFEPFFTTKEKGKGTGLGLSMVHGIVKQSRGYIVLFSEPGVGTQFKIYLPRAEAATRRAPISGRVPVAGGTERILVVEDEMRVRQAAHRILAAAGYAVRDAESGEEARSILEAESDSVDLLLTDVVLPHMSGPEVAELARAAVPGIGVLFMSGYSDETLQRYAQAGAEHAFLEKPFTEKQLLAAVREALGDEGETERRPITTRVG